MNGIWYTYVDISLTKWTMYLYRCHSTTQILNKCPVTCKHYSLSSNLTVWYKTYWVANILATKFGILPDCLRDHYKVNMSYSVVGYTHADSHVRLGARTSAGPAVTRSGCCVCRDGTGTQRVKWLASSDVIWRHGTVSILVLVLHC